MGASAVRSAKALGYHFATDVTDDAAVYDAIASKLHVDAEHMAREPAPPGIRMAALQCIIGQSPRIGAGVSASPLRSPLPNGPTVSSAWINNAAPSEGADGGSLGGSLVTIK